MSVLGWNPNRLVGWVVGLLGVCTAFAAVIVLLGRLAPALMKLIGAPFRLVATVEPVASADGPPQRVEVTVRVRSKRKGLGPLRAYSGASISVSPLGPFVREQLRGSGAPRRLTAELPLHPDPLRTTLPPRVARALRRALDVHMDELALLIGRKATPGAWEAALGLNQVTASDGAMKRDFRSFRAYETLAHRPAPTRPPVVAVLCASPFALLAEASWLAGHITPRLFYGEDLRTFEHVPVANVLHLIGTTVPDELRPALALEGVTAYTLQPDRLPLPDADVIIVQAEPTRSSVSADPRTDSVRAIAHDIAVASAGAAVIAIPVLPSHLAAKLTEEIARTLVRERASRRDLLALVHRMRGMVFEAGDPEDAVAARALPAFDICLYLGV